MAQMLTVARTDIEGPGNSAAYVDWLVAINRWSQENGIGTIKMIVGKPAGGFEVTLDPALTGSELSQFQTELDTLKSVDGTPGNYVFTHI